MSPAEVKKILDKALQEHGYSPGEVGDLTIKEITEILGIRASRQIADINLN